MRLFAIVGLAAAVLAGCTGATSTLNPGLTARMDQAGATLDRAVALSILNEYRATAGAPPLILDPALNEAAQAAATRYAEAGIQDGRDALGPVAARIKARGQAAEQVSAGQPTFADTFSGWRNSPDDARVLASAWARHAGLGVVYDAESEFGTYWVLILAENLPGT